SRDPIAGAHVRFEQRAASNALSAGTGSRLLSGILLGREDRPACRKPCVARVPETAFLRSAARVSKLPLASSVRPRGMPILPLGRSARKSAHSSFPLCDHIAARAIPAGNVAGLPQMPAPASQLRERLRSPGRSVYLQHM